MGGGGHDRGTVSAGITAPSAQHVDSVGVCSHIPCVERGRQVRSGRLASRPDGRSRRRAHAGRGKRGWLMVADAGQRRLHQMAVVVLSPSILTGAIRARAGEGRLEGGAEVAGHDGLLRCCPRASLSSSRTLPRTSNCSIRRRQPPLHQPTPPVSVPAGL